MTPEKLVSIAKRYALKFPPYIREDIESEYVTSVLEFVAKHHGGDLASLVPTSVFKPGMWGAVNFMRQFVVGVNAPSEKRRARLKCLHSAPEAFNVQAPPQEFAYDQVSAELIKKMHPGLPPIAAELVAMRLQGLSYAQIAAASEYSLEGVHKIVCDAIERIHRKRGKDIWYEWF
jgi:hypothetical protein